MPGLVSTDLCQAAIRLEQNDVLSLLCVAVLLPVSLQALSTALVVMWKGRPNEPMWRTKACHCMGSELWLCCQMLPGPRAATISPRFGVLMVHPTCNSMDNRRLVQGAGMGQNASWIHDKVCDSDTLRSRRDMLAETRHQPAASFIGGADLLCSQAAVGKEHEGTLTPCL